MPLTSTELRNNYVAAVLFAIGPPYTLQRTDYSIRDDGLTNTPNPYIASWSVIGVAQPSDAFMMANTTMANIASVEAVVNLDIVSYDVVNSGTLTLTGMPRLFIETSSSQTMANNTLTPIIAAWGTATTSGGLTFDAGTATVTIPSSGVYFMVLNMAYGYNTNVNKERSVYIEVNGTTRYKSRVSANTNDVSDSAIVATCISIPLTLTLVANDTLRPWGFMTTSGGVNGTLPYGSVNGERGYWIINKLY